MASACPHPKRRRHSVHKRQRAFAAQHPRKRAGHPHGAVAETVARAAGQVRRERNAVEAEERMGGLQASLGVTADRFVVVGGGAQNTFWMQNKADKVGKPFEIPQIEEATPLGAAILAGMGVGRFRDEQEAFERVYRPGRVLEPDLRRTAQYAERFQVFQRLHPALKEIHADLRRLG